MFPNNNHIKRGFPCITEVGINPLDPTTLVVSNCTLEGCKQRVGTGSTANRARNDELLARHNICWGKDIYIYTQKTQETTGMTRNGITINRNGIGGTRMTSSTQQAATIQHTTSAESVTLRPYEKCILQENKLITPLPLGKIQVPTTR